MVFGRELVSGRSAIRGRTLAGTSNNVQIAWRTWPRSDGNARQFYVRRASPDDDLVIALRQIKIPNSACRRSHQVCGEPVLHWDFPFGRRLDRLGIDADKHRIGLRARSFYGSQDRVLPGGRGSEGKNGPSPVRCFRARGVQEITVRQNERAGDPRLRRLQVGDVLSFG